MIFVINFILSSPFTRREKRDNLKKDNQQEEVVSKQIAYQDKPWLKYYEEGVPDCIDFEDLTLPSFLYRTAREHPGRTALVFEGYRMRYRDFSKSVNLLAKALRNLGIQKGDAVSILLPNTIACVISYYAILETGAVVVMNNPLYSDRELLHQIKDSGSVAIITLDLMAKRILSMMPSTRLKHLVYASLGDHLPFPKNLLFPFVARQKKFSAPVPREEGVYSFMQLIREAEKDTESVQENPEVLLDDTAVYQYTGGTTGRSKGVVLTHRNLSYQVQQVAAWFPAFRENDKEMMLGALPFFHVFGMTTAMNLSVYTGWGNILVPRPQPEELLSAIRNYRPTFVPLVPTMYIGMLSHPDIHTTDMTCIKGCFSGSAPLPVEVILEFEKKTGAVIVEGYGLTESSPVTHINPFGGKRKVGSIGIPVPNTECMVASLDDGVSAVPAGEAGEILVRGPQIMKQYLHHPEETAMVLNGDGWLHTGDIGRMDEDGFFFIVDRKKDMIISGGLNVYPSEIEEVFLEHPKVHEVCSVGIPHPSRGEAVKLFIVLRKGETATKQEFMDYCKTRLAKFKWPVEIEFKEDLPRSSVGKILRQELKKTNL